MQRDNPVYQNGYEWADGCSLEYLPLNILVDVLDSYRTAALVIESGYYLSIARRVYEEIGCRPAGKAVALARTMGLMA